MTYACDVIKLCRITQLICDGVYLRTSNYGDGTNCYKINNKYRWNFVHRISIKSLLQQQQIYNFMTIESHLFLHSESLMTMLVTLYTLCLKKVHTFQLSVTLSNLNRFQTFCTAGKRTKFATKPIWHYHLTLGMLPHYLVKLKIQIFCRCGRKCKQIAFLIASNFVNHPQILIFSVFKIASLSPYWL